MENMWALLPEGLTDLFGTKLSYLEDAIRFGAVCKSWQFATKRSQFAPWLMLATYDEDQGGIQKFFSLYSGNLHDIKSPKFQGRKCWGTPHGWLVTLGLDLNIHLLNPLTGIEYSLPPQSTFKNQFDIELPNQHLRYGFVNKFVLSAAPDALHPRESCVVFAINSPTSDLAFARPGDNTWIHVETPHRGFHDVIFFKDQIYAIDRVGALVVCDINNKTTVDFAPPPKGVATTNMFYLVEMHGALHFVERIIVDDLITDFFEAHKFDFSTKSWTEIPGFDDYALFLGSGNSFAISISDFPEFRPNSIYFTDVHPMHHPYDMENDMGVYDFEEQTIDTLYCGDNVCSEFSRPIFIMPSLL